ncbi:hypothetical protein FO519_002865 [Halicephalobus sp. NKZ332]|nr:hypothetical protein FO519_002865 [Halicephalobus sp. NKZ332]
MLMKSALFLFFLVTVSDANPYFRKKFQAILIKDQCLKACMDPIVVYGEELSLLKNTDLGSYFANHEKTCQVISNARKCIQDCNIESNPFQLQVMVAHCSNETRQKIDQLRSCFIQNGTQISESCTSTCGNYRAVNTAVHELTKATGPNISQEATQEIAEKSNQACGIFKCMTRCNVGETKNLCGEETGNILQNLIQNIVNAQRADLEKLNIVDTMVRSNPPECNYMYAPEAMFNEDSLKTPQTENQNEHQNPIFEAQMAIFAKQMQILEKQEKILEKENHKLNLELVLLQHKEALQNEGRLIY